MSLFKRRVTRRAAGVGVGVALLMLGVEAPAMAAAPTITAISPTSGPVGCVVDIAGTGFDQPGAFAVDTVKFTGTNINSVAAKFVVVSDTEIWASVPTGAKTGAITVTNKNAEKADSPVFTVTTLPDAGGCAPTVASFTPTCGVVGDHVTVTGTNLLNSNATGSIAPVGGDVRFNPYAANAAHTGSAESPTTLVVNVPADAIDGPIRVTTVAGTATSTASFNVATDPAECVGGPGPTHGRSITLTLRRHLRARGVVSLTDAADTTTECIAGVPVKIQRRVSGHWKNVGSTTTNDNGAYKRRIKDKAGRYRALAPKVTLASGDVCSKAVSPTRKHRH